MDQHAVQIKTWKDHFLKEYPKIFNDSSENEVKMDIDTTVETKSAIDREEKQRKVERKLLSNKTNERFTNYFDVINDPKLTLAQKIIYSKKGLTIQPGERFTMHRYKEKYLKNAFSNQRKFIKKLWRKRRLQDGGRYVYENYKNLFSTTVNLTFALFLYVFFTLTET